MNVFLKHLNIAVLNAADNPSAVRQIDPVAVRQMALANKAVRLLRSLYADIDALRVGKGNYFQGTGKCECGCDEAEVELEWPNLAALVDETEELLEEIRSSDIPEKRTWFVFHGDCKTMCRTLADNKEEAMANFQAMMPGQIALAAVQETAHDQLVMEGYGNGEVSCPKCGGSTSYIELPRDWQAHDCKHCQHGFIAVPNFPAKKEEAA